MEYEGICDLTLEKTPNTCKSFQVPITSDLASLPYQSQRRQPEVNRMMMCTSDSKQIPAKSRGGKKRK